MISVIKPLPLPPIYWKEKTARMDFSPLTTKLLRAFYTPANWWD